MGGSDPSEKRNQNPPAPPAMGESAAFAVSNEEATSTRSTETTTTASTSAATASNASSSASTSRPTSTPTTTESPFETLQRRHLPYEQRRAAAAAAAAAVAKERSRATTPLAPVHPAPPTEAVKWATTTPSTADINEDTVRAGNNASNPPRPTVFDVFQQLKQPQEVQGHQSPQPAYSFGTAPTDNMTPAMANSTMNTAEAISPTTAVPLTSAVPLPATVKPGNDASSTGATDAGLANHHGSSPPRKPPLPSALRSYDRSASNVNVPSSSGDGAVAAGTHVVGPPPVLSKTNHVAGSSAGAAGATTPVPAHQRNVSWGQNSIFPPGTGKPPALATLPRPQITTTPQQQASWLNLQQPVLGGGSTAGFDGGMPAASIRTSPSANNNYNDTEQFISNFVEHAQSLPEYRPAMLSPRDRRRTTGTATATDRVVDLDDWIKRNPYESEAETYIMKAIEQRESAARARADTAAADPAAHVMPHVPDEAWNVLGNNSNNRSNGAGTNDEEKKDEDIIGSSSQTTYSQNVPRSPSDNGSTVGTNTAAATTQKSTAAVAEVGAAVVNAGAAARIMAARARRHRRNETMEEKLYGLTTAMDAIHAKHTNEDLRYLENPIAGTGVTSSSGLGAAVGPNPNAASSSTDGPPRERFNTMDSVGVPKEEPVSSADAFQHNASILFHRARKSGDIPSPEAMMGYDPYLGDDRSHDTAHSSKGRWRMLKATVQVSGMHHRQQQQNPQRQQQQKPQPPLHPKKNDDLVQVESISEGDGDDNDDVENMEQGASTAAPACMDTLSHSTPGGDSSGANANNCNPGNSNHSKPPECIDVGDMGDPPLSKNKLEMKLFQDFQEFFSPRMKNIYLFVKTTVFLLIVPATSVAFILFYFAGNPPTGILINKGHPVNGTLINEDGGVVSPTQASVSWFLLFLGVRQVFTFMLAKGTELFVIDFLSIRSKVILSLFGPWTTLFVMQSKGWPFLIFAWALYDFALLSGSGPFFSHWLYWQDAVKLFNESNPSGGVVGSDWHRRVVAIAVSVAAAVAFKRFWLGLYLGRRTYARFSDQLATVMQKIVLISEVASLALTFEKYAYSRAKADKRILTPFQVGLSAERLGGLMESVGDDGSTEGPTPTSDFSMDNVSQIIDPGDRHPLTGSLSSAQKGRIVQLLGAWEEPRVSEQVTERISISSILQFRRAMAFLNTDFPFAVSFGLAGTRGDMIESAQEVYDRLLLRNADDGVLHFDLMALIGVSRHGTLNPQKLKELIRLFRPNRDGTLTLLDFVKSVDSVYRQLRVLRAAVINSGKIDHAFENIFNIIFYAVVVTVILSQLGFDPLALFLSISGVVLAFAFMISTASSKYFEGLLFILVRRPYNIGDGIHISNVEDTTPASGAPWWKVEDVTLFTTTAISLFTGERATLSNGSLASSRVINSSNSPPAWLSILLKFPVGVPYDKLQIFSRAVEQYVRNRPREYLSFNTFRATRFEADLGFIEYIIVVNHRESWDNWGALQQSKANLNSFSLELSKKLGIWYRAPPMPVDLTVMTRKPPEVGMNFESPAFGPEQLSLSPGAGITGMNTPDTSSLEALFPPSS